MNSVSQSFFTVTVPRTYEGSGPMSMAFTLPCVCLVHYFHKYRHLISPPIYLPVSAYICLSVSFDRKPQRSPTYRKSSAVMSFPNSTNFLHNLTFNYPHSIVCPQLPDVQSLSLAAKSDTFLSVARSANPRFLSMRCCVRHHISDPWKRELHNERLHNLVP